MKFLFLRFAGLGDAMFVNTIAFHYARTNSCRVYVATNYPSIFQGTPRVTVLPTKSQKIAHQMGKLMMRFGIINSMLYLGYQPENVGPKLPALRRHILSVLAAKVGLSPAPARPCLFLSRKEIERGSLPAGTKPWIAMHSTGVTAMTENKNWFPERFQEVARQLRTKFRIVQLGLKSDPSLDCDCDLRDRISPRRAAAVLASCKALISQEGYLMHAATAVGTPTVTIFGGFISPEESGYSSNENLFTELPCSPCWLMTKCPFDKECMDKISSQTVLSALDRLLARQEMTADRKHELHY